MSESGELTVTPLFRALPSLACVPPSIVATAGPAATFAWEEFFAANLRNPHTRAAYACAVRQFFKWLEPSGVELAKISPGMLGSYFAQHPGSVPTRNLHLAALRALFDLFVMRHVMVLNPAQSVRGERYQAVEGKTPEISPAHAKALLASIDISTGIGLRDRAIIGMLIYTAARAGAVAKLRMRDLTHDGTQYLLRFAEKGGKSREIPVHHLLQNYLLGYLAVAGLKDASGDSPFFRSCWKRSGILTGSPVTGQDICRLVKRRLKAAGLPTGLSPHSFRVATITDLLSNGVSLEDTQFLAGHTDPRTTKLYDRRQKKITRNIIEQITI